jgi:hypothetical protein
MTVIEVVFACVLIRARTPTCLKILNTACACYPVEPHVDWWSTV